MKFVLPVIALVVLLIYGTLQFQARSEYEELRTKVQSWGDTIVPMEAHQREAIEEIRESWHLLFEFDRGAEREIMQHLGYSPNLNGMVECWTDVMPPYSLWDPDRNRLWVLRAAYKQLRLPNDGVGHYGEGVILYQFGEGEALLIEETPEGVFDRAYTREVEQSGARQSTAPSGSR